MPWVANKRKPPPRTDAESQEGSVFPVRKTTGLAHTERYKYAEWRSEMLEMGAEGVGEKSFYVPRVDSDSVEESR